MLGFFPWEPDQGPYSDTSTDYVQNLTPLAQGWGPFPKLSDVSVSLGATCVGSAYYRASDGSFGMVAGTTTALFKLNTADGTWTDISGAVYSVPSGQLWQFERFGTGLYATNLDDPLQVYDVDAGGTFGNAPGSPPQAKYIRAIGDFLLLGYLKIGADEFPQSFQWSGLNDAATWTVGTKFSDRQILPDGDEIVGLMKATFGGRVMQRNAKRSLVRDAQYIFRVGDIDPDNGVVAPYSIIPIGADSYLYLAEDGFYKGDERTPIGAERVNRYFFEDADASSLDTVQGGVNPFDKYVIWTYTDGSGNRKSIGYDWQLDRWFRTDIAVEIYASAVTAGYTLEELDAFGTVDTLPASMDSRIWMGGRPTFAAFTSDFKLKGFTGANAQAEVRTGQVELTPGSRAFLNGARAKTDSDDYTMAVATADLHGGSETWGSNVSPSAAGMVPFRASARLHRLKIIIAEGDVWSHLHTEVDTNGFVQREGQR
jgi:hypothetical protein